MILMFKLTRHYNVASLPAGANDDLVIEGNDSFGRILVSPNNAGQATISIAPLPQGFAIPSNRDDNVIATVTAANAFLRTNTSSNHTIETTVGIDLQLAHRIGLAVTPPAPVDIAISIPVSSGVLISSDSTTSGVTSLIFEDVTTASSPTFYIQGTSLGDDIDFSIDVYEANTTIPIGYNSLSSTVDIDPSGVYMATADYQTNTFANNRSLIVQSALLFDDEDTSRNGQYRSIQSVRGGIDLNVPLTTDDVSVAALPAGTNDTLVIPSGQKSGSIELDPLTAGVALVSITAQPNANLTLPSNRNDEVEITVTAPDARFLTSNVLVGDELQIPVSVSLEAIPPNPVDVTVEITSDSIALISKVGTTAGTASVTFENVTATSVGTIYVQGLTLDGATQITVSAPGYNDGTAAVEVVNSGFRLTGNSSNIDAGGTRNLTISSVRLNANGTFSSQQQVRGGTSFSIATSSSMPAVGSISNPVTLSGGQSFNTATFSAISSGTTTIQIIQPAGFTPPVGGVDEDITVN